MGFGHFLEQGINGRVFVLYYPENF